MTAYSSEFASMLTSSGMDMVVFLTDIYDCPPEWSHKTKAGGTNKIKAPFLNLIGATTPSWISTAMPLDTLGIGLPSRMVFVFEDTPRVRDPFLTLTTDQIKLGELLAEDLAKIADISGEYVMDTDAKTYLRDWYLNRDAQKSNDPKLAGYYDRKHAHLMKLCMVIAASKRDETVITLEDLGQAFSMLKYVETNMHLVFAGVGKNPINADKEEVFGALGKNANGLTLGELLEKFGYSLRKEELMEVLDTLMTIGKVRTDGKKWFLK